jgi:hypothetical protein
MIRGRDVNRKSTSGLSTAKSKSRERNKPLLAETDKSKVSTAVSQSNNT